jgi:hypothetical protein
MCSSRHWEWNGIRFSRPTSSTRSLILDAGVLVGKPRNEFELGSGDLTWHPADGRTQVLHSHNVVAVEPAQSGAIVLFGSARSLVDGSAVGVSRRGYGGWSLSEVARLPFTADALATISPNLFAAWSANRFVVFSDQEIVGLAKCAEN